MVECGFARERVVVSGVGGVMAEVVE